MLRVKILVFFGNCCKAVFFKVMLYVRGDKTNIKTIDLGVSCKYLMPTQETD